MYFSDRCGLSYADLGNTIERCQRQFVKEFKTSRHLFKARALRSKESGNQSKARVSGLRTLGLGLRPSSSGTTFVLMVCSTASNPNTEELAVMVWPIPCWSGRGAVILALGVDERVNQQLLTPWFRIAEERRGKVLDWLYSGDFNARHDEINSIRQEGTGQWLLERPEIREWAEQRGNCRLLWGRGIRMCAGIQ